MSPIAVRRLGPSDFAQYKTIRLEAVKQEPTAFGGSYEDEVLLEDSFYQDRFAGLWAAPDNGVFGAFTSAEELVGVAGLFRQSNRKMSHKGMLWGMYVRSSYRKFGVGRQLVETVISFARSIPVDLVGLCVVECNLPAVRFYESLGFRAWGAEPSALRYQGRDYVDLHMSLDLRLGSPRPN